MEQKEPMGTRRAVYAHATIGREGLANRLYPWGRAELFCRHHQAAMLAPRWVRLKLGPLLRGDRDKRFYVGQFGNHGYVAGLKKWWILKTARIIDEKSFRPEMLGESRRPLVVDFSGMTGEFATLWGSQEYLYSRLLSILSPAARQMFAQTAIDWQIGLHVRRTDMPVMTAGAQAASFAAQPEAWFTGVLRKLRAAAGWTVPARIFTDARANDLPLLSQEPAVSIGPAMPAVVDLLLMSRSRVLITSGKSTFSHWAVFFGQMASVWYPGMRRIIPPDQPQRSLETDESGNLIDSSAVDLHAVLEAKR